MTLSRREFFGCWLPLIVPLAVTQPPSPVLYDDRAAALLQNLAPPAHVVLRKMPDDLADVYHDLVKLQATSVGARRLMGVTDPQLLFAIEALASHVGFKLAFLGRHARTHMIIGPAAVVRAFHSASSLAGWQFAVLDAMASVRGTAETVRTLHWQREALLAPRTATLFSWVLLPRTTGATGNLSEGVV